MSETVPGHMSSREARGPRVRDFQPEDRERADLCWGMVRGDLHGRGLGRRLTRARLARAVADRSLSEVRLGTSQLTTGFYERLGFRTVSVETEGLAPGLDRCEMAARAEELRRRLKAGRL